MQVLTLKNLDFTGSPGRRLVVIGDPVSHSLSPVMHNAALDNLATENPDFKKWCYQAVRVASDELPDALRIFHESGVKGINLTIPHKVRVLDLIEEMDETSRNMGAVNTLLWTETGYRGTNTDGFGILRAIEEAFDKSPRDSDVWIFGAGGAARGILVACLEAAAARITVVNRNPERLELFKNDLLRNPVPGMENVRYFSSDENPCDTNDNCIIINATSLGLKEGDPSPIPDALIVPGNKVYDTTYGIANELARKCRAAGISYADGLAMLVWQGAKSLELWTGRMASVMSMRKAAESELERRKIHG